MLVKSSLARPHALASRKRLKIRPLALQRLLLVSSILILFFLAGCSAGSPVSGSTLPTETVNPVVPSATTEPTATAEPTATPEPTATLEPTPTPLPPTATPLPALAVQPDGFEAWCAPLEYSGTQPDGPDAPDYARQMTLQGELYRVPIPAVYCTVVFHFNQPVPVDGSSSQAKVEIQVMDGSSPFIQQPLQVAAGQADTAWTTLIHPYVINPPFWEVTYTLVIQEPDGSPLWSSPVTFAKPLPEPCLFGGLPDPVTLVCPVTDPWEIEPWPDVEYPYDRSRLTPEP